MSNQNGSSTILMVMLTMFLSLFFLYSIEHAKNNLLSNRSRAKAYLCMKTQLGQVATYSKRMEQFNSAIALTFKLQVIPKVKALHQTLVYSQQLYHFSFVKNLAQKGPCHFTQRLSFFKNLPYKTHARLLLKRKVNGAAVKEDKKSWQYTLTNFTGEDGAKPAFILRVKVAWSRGELKIKESQEEAILAWSRSQLFSYSPSPPAWWRSPSKLISKLTRHKPN